MGNRRKPVGIDQKVSLQIECFGFFTRAESRFAVLGGMIGRGIRLEPARMARNRF